MAELVAFACFVADGHERNGKTYRSDRVHIRVGQQGICRENISLDLACASTNLIQPMGLRLEDSRCLIHQARNRHRLETDRLRQELRPRGLNTAGAMALSPTALWRNHSIVKWRTESQPVRWPAQRMIFLWHHAVGGIY